MFADAERGIGKAKRDGNQIGSPPFGYYVEDGSYTRIQLNTTALKNPPRSDKWPREEHDSSLLRDSTVRGTVDPEMGASELRNPVRHQ